MGVLAPMDSTGAYLIGYFFLFSCAIALAFISRKKKEMRFMNYSITILLIAPALVLGMFIAADYL
jgi:hypothetical protein